MTHFQVPGDRVFNSSDKAYTLSPWPASADGYRLFVTGASGDERIGIQLGQRIDLQLTDGKGYNLETTKSLAARRAKSPEAAVVLVALANQAPIALSDLVATTDQQKFVVSARNAGTTVLSAVDAALNVKATLQVVVGKFDNHPDMRVDLIADVCRGSDSFRIHALQRMLHNQYLGKDAHNNDRFSNGDNVFEQHATPNVSSDPKIGTMTCGLVARWRTEQVFPKILAPTADWYRVGAIHEPLSDTLTDRKQVKYRTDRIETLRGQILRALNDGQAVRVGVLDSPIGMTPENGDLVAYRAGGHTLVIVGCSKDDKEFLYIDPWGGGSMMEYKGGIAGNGFPGKCCQIGKLVMAHDPDRRVKRTDVANNIIREHPGTEGSFRYSAGNYLEVVSAPFTVPGRK